MLCRRSLALVLTGASLLTVAPLFAQNVPEAPAPPSPRWTVQDSVILRADSMRLRLDTLRSRSFFSRDSLQSIMTQAFTVRRVRIGVVAHGWPAESDSIGVLLDGVTPGGPAAAAGLQAGDIITRFGNAPLAVQLTKVPPGSQVPSPSLRLVELVAKLPPNDTVTVEYRRGKSRKTTRVVTAAEPEHLAVIVGPEGSFSFNSMPGAEEYWLGGSEAAARDRALEMSVRRSEHARAAAEASLGQANVYLGMSRLMNLDLASVNPQLGSYFGTTDGVLVVNVPEPAPLGLKAGDVVLSVDGRTVTSPRQLMRVLGSYEPGEALRMEVMRQKKRVTLKGTIGR